MEHAYLRYADRLELSGAQISKLMCEVLARGGTFRFRAGGSSMFPFIRDGDVVSIVSLPSRTPRLGAVIAFRRQTRQAFTARIWASTAWCEGPGADSTSWEITTAEGRLKDR